MMNEAECENSSACNDSGNLDEEWKYIQKCTFTNWCNSVLASSGVTITDLYVDMCDGVVFVKLYESISGRRIKRFVKNPKVVSHKLENVSLVLKAMGDDGVKFVNIDPLDICQGNSKLILALVWHMILYYQIGVFSINPNEAFCRESPPQIPYQKKSSAQEDSVPCSHSKIQSVSNPKTLMLKLINSFLNKSGASNLNSDWNSGKLLAELVENLSPGSCSTYSTWNEKNTLLNVTTALCLAEVHLGIPVLIEPHHMVAKNVDEISMITYLSSFTKDGGVIEKALVRKLVEKFPDLHSLVQNMTTDWNNGLALCKLLKSCDSSSLPQGFHENVAEMENDAPNYREKCLFNVTYAMSEAKRLFGIQSLVEPEIIISKNVSALAVMSYICEFVHLNPKKALLCDNNALVTQFYLNLITEAKDVTIGNPVRLMIGSDAKDISEQEMDFSVRRTDQKSSSDIESIKIFNKSKRLLMMEFVPQDATEYSVEVRYQGQMITGSPIFVSPKFKPLCASDVIVEGYNDCPINVGQSLTMLVRVKRSAKIINFFLQETATKRQCKCQYVRISDQMFKILNKMELPGVYQVILSSDDGSDLSIAEVECKNACCDPLKVKGEKELYAHAGEFIDFHVERLTLDDGKFDVKVRPHDPKNSHCFIENLNVQFINSSWKISFRIPVADCISWIVEYFWNEKLVSSESVLVHTFSWSNVKISGNGYQDYVVVATKNEILLYVGDCGSIKTVSGALHSKSKDQSHNLIFKMLENNLYQCSYSVNKASSFWLKLFLNGKEIETLSKSIEVIDLNQLESQISPGENVEVGQKIDVKVTIPRKAGIGDLFYAMEGPTGPMKVIVESVTKKYKCDEYVLSSTPSSAGKHKLILNFGGLQIPGFPKIFDVKEMKHVDVNQVKVDLTQLSAAVLHFENKCSVFVKDEAGEGSLIGYFTFTDSENSVKTFLDFHLKSHNKGVKKYVAKYYVEQRSDITFRFYFDSNELNESPIVVPVIDLEAMSFTPVGEIPSDVVVGNRYLLDFAISHPEIHKHLSACLICPDEKVIDCVIRSFQHQDLDYQLLKSNSVCQIEFVPDAVGTYSLDLRYRRHSLLPGFPIRFASSEPETFEETMVQIQIDQPKGEYQIGDLISVIVDGRHADSGPVEATVLDAGGYSIEVAITPVISKSEQQRDNTKIYQITFNFEKVGTYYLSVFWNNKIVSGCPFEFKATSPLPAITVRNAMISDGLVGDPIHVHLDNVFIEKELIECTCLNSSRKRVKTKIEPCKSEEHSYVISIFPQTTGMHQLEITACGKSVAGSPLYFEVSHKIDAKNVKIYGPGIESGVINESKGLIFAKTDNSGSGVMQVAIQGPKDGFRLTVCKTDQEFSKESPSVLTMDYCPNANGLYVVNVLWSSEHVPGSPFFVYNCIDELELEEIKRGQIPTNFLSLESLKSEGSYVWG